MRGKGIVLCAVVVLCGITPAYAGKSVIGFHLQNCFWDHPRLCGEKCTASLKISQCIGSPPPMRGKEFPLFLPRFHLRITPAYAGKSELLRCENSPAEDHPRLCGEKNFTMHINSPLRGSPPPMRGKVKFKTDLFSFSRITPAYAGKRFKSFVDGLRIEDHPRLCGEKGHTRRSGLVEQGSPPPMRGKVFDFLTGARIARITPAYAGKSGGTPETAGNQQDHPRLCGEKVILNRFTAFTIGSPPPMRGKAFQTSSFIPPVRIPPAYAGKRQKNFTKSCWVRDPPRLCGEKGMEKKLHICFMGSPPPMRGKVRQKSVSMDI